MPSVIIALSSSMDSVPSSEESPEMTEMQRYSWINEIEILLHAHIKRPLIKRAGGGASEMEHYSGYGVLSFLL